MGPRELGRIGQAARLKMLAAYYRTAGDVHRAARLDGQARALERPYPLAGEVAPAHFTVNLTDDAPIPTSPDEAQALEREIELYYVTLRAESIAELVRPDEEARELDPFDERRHWSNPEGRRHLAQLRTRQQSLTSHTRIRQRCDRAPARTSSRPRGAGRPRGRRTAARSSARSGDSGSGLAGDPDPEPPPLVAYTRHGRLGLVNAPLARFLREIAA